MKKGFEPVDLMVAVGLCATVFCIYFMFMAADGVLGGASGTPPSTGRTPTMMDATEFVQPALGQAIVENYLLEREGAAKLEKAVDRLNHAVMAKHLLQNSASTLSDRLRSYADRVEADHVARVQFVLGRRIVDFTARGIRTGILSDTQAGRAYNRSMIEMLKKTGTRMNDEFVKTRDQILGSEIMTASRAIDEYSGQIQTQIGRAVTDVTRAEWFYTDALAGAQEQLAKVVLASVHTDQITERFEQLAAADVGEPGGIAVTEQRTWPDVPGEYFVAASAVLVGIFVAGLAWPTGRREPLVKEERPETGTYRKAI